MSNTIPSPNMNMPIPTAGQEDGPQWALDVNASLGIVDGHDHTPGYGVPITPNGLSISSDLTFGTNNAIDLRTVRFTSQSAVLTQPLDLDCLYVVAGDLYYNDGVANNVRITQSGGVAGSPGSISNLTSPASAAYVALNSTFVWQSDSNTPANMDFASAIFRNLTSGSSGLTLQPPAAMASDFTLTLPSLPASQKIMTLDNTGAMSAPYSVDGSTITISSNIIGVPNSGIGTNQLAAGSVTAAKMAAGAVPLTSHTFTANDNFTIPTGVVQLIVEVQGGGGGGAGGGGGCGNGAGSQGGGGGGGGGSAGQHIITVLAVNPGDVWTVSVGAGGPAASGGAGGVNAGDPGSNGNNGTESFFGSGANSTVITAFGGQGGNAGGGGNAGATAGDGAFNMYPPSAGGGPATNASSSRFLENGAGGGGGGLSTPANGGNGGSTTTDVPGHGTGGTGGTSVSGRGGGGGGGAGGKSGYSSGASGNGGAGGSNNAGGTSSAGIFGSGGGGGGGGSGNNAGTGFSGSNGSAGGNGVVKLTWTP